MTTIVPEPVSKWLRMWGAAGSGARRQASRHSVKKKSRRASERDRVSSSIPKNNNSQHRSRTSSHNVAEPPEEAC